MSNLRTSLLESLISRRREPEALRRVDFKGERRRLTLRLPRNTVLDLEIIKLTIGSGRWTVDQVSEGCAKNKPATRGACATIAILKEEAARAREAERLADEIKTLTKQLSTTPVIKTADAQTDALTFLGRFLHLLPKEDKTKPQDNTATGYGLALLMAIFIELGSGHGLYIATTPWRVTKNRQQADEPSAPPLPAMADGPPLEAFAAERLQRKNSHQLHLAVAFEAYKEWCEQRQKPMQGRSRFERGLLKLAKELGLDVDSTRSGWVVRDVALRAPGKLAPMRLTARVL